MKIISILILFLFSIVFNGCSSNKELVPIKETCVEKAVQNFITLDTSGVDTLTRQEFNEENKQQLYEKFFDDLDNIIQTKNVSVIMEHKKTYDKDKNFYMQLDTIESDNDIVSIYFNLTLDDVNSVEIYNINGINYIGFSDINSSEWYLGEMDTNTIFTLEKNTTAVKTIFDGYVIDNVEWISEEEIDNIIYDKVHLILHNDKGVSEEYDCYVNNVTSKLERIDVLGVSNELPSYSIFIKPINGIVMPNAVYNKKDLPVLSNVDFDMMFLEVLVNAMGNSLDIDDISELE